MPTEILDQPENERQEDREDDAAGEGKVDPPIPAAEREVAGQTEQADPAQEQDQQADYDHRYPGRDQPFAELLRAEIHQNLLLMIYDL